MKKVLFLTFTLVALSWACGSESTTKSTGDSTQVADSAHPRTDTLTTDTTAADTMSGEADNKGADPNAGNDRTASWAAKNKGTLVGNFGPNGQLDVVLPAEALKITAFRDFLKDGYRITKGWVETAPGGKYYLMGSAGMGEKSMTIAKELTRGGNQLLLPDKGLLVHVCEGQGCNGCTMNWDARGGFKDCGCGQDSRRTCQHRAEKK